jgi:hypothetical protein
MRRGADVEGDLPPVLSVRVRLVVVVHVFIKHLPLVDVVSGVSGPIKDLPVFLTIEAAKHVHKLVNIM